MSVRGRQEAWDMAVRRKGKTGSGYTGRGDAVREKCTLSQILGVEIMWGATYVQKRNTTEREGSPRTKSMEMVAIL